MFKALLIVLLATVILADKVRTKSPEYASWKAEHGVSFNNAEDQYRAFIFSEKLKEIEAHNQSPHHTWKKGVNKFSAMTDEEFESTHLGAKPPKSVLKELDTEDDTESEEDSNNPPAPDSDTDTESETGSGVRVNAPAKRAYSPKVGIAAVDWTAKGKVTDVRDQGQCGSCWAFCSVAAIQSAYLIKNSTSLDLSEQQLVDCTYDNYDGCNGGWMHHAYNHIRKNNNGITTESAYPYTFSQVDGTCHQGQEGGAYKIKTVLYSNKISKCRGLRQIVKLSPVSVALDASGWSSYVSGIFNSNCGRMQLNHAVLLTGYDSSSNWRIKNSWGVGWGDNGYITLKKNNCRGICKNRGEMVIV